VAVKLLPRKYPRTLAADPVSVSIRYEGAKVPDCTPVDVTPFTHVAGRISISISRCHGDVALRTRAAIHVGLRTAEALSLEIIKFNDLTSGQAIARRCVALVRRHAPITRREIATQAAIKNPRHSRRRTSAHSAGSERKTIYYLSVRRVPRLRCIGRNGNERGNYRGLSFFLFLLHRAIASNDQRERERERERETEPGILAEQWAAPRACTRY